MRHMNLGTHLGEDAQRRILGAKTFVCTYTMTDGSQDWAVVEAADPLRAKSLLGFYNHDSQMMSAECTDVTKLFGPLPAPQ